MNKPIIQSIRKELVVEASQETAFKVFTEGIDDWWPKTHHIGSSPMTVLILEPGLDGRWYSKHEDGSEATVGKVLMWDPYQYIVLAWQINGDFKFDPELISEVEVQFISESARTTRVKLEHKNLDRLGGGKTVESMDKGWGYIIDLYKNLIESDR